MHVMNQEQAQYSPKMGRKKGYYYIYNDPSPFDVAFRMYQGHGSHGLTTNQKSNPETGCK